MNQLEIHAKEINRPVTSGLTKIAFLLTLINLVIGIVLIVSLNSTNSQVDTINGTLTNNLNWLMNNDTVTLAQNISSLNTTFLNLQASVNNLTTNYTALNDQVTNNTNTLSNLNQAFEYALGNATQNLTTVNATLSGLIEAASTVASGAQNATNELNTTLTSVQTSVSNANTAIQGLQTDINNNNASALAIAQNVTYIQGNFTSLQGLVEAAQTNVTYIQGNLTYLTTTNQYSRTYAPTTGAATLNLANVTSQDIAFTTNGALVCQVGGIFSDASLSTNTIQLEVGVNGAFSYTFNFPVSGSSTTSFAFSGFIFVPVSSATEYWGVNALSAASWTAPTFSINCLTVL